MVSNKNSQFTGYLPDISRIQKGRLKQKKEIFSLDVLSKKMVDTLQDISHHIIEVHGKTKNNQQKVFERFYKGSDKNRDAFSGFDIGLYVSSRIIKRHSGSIRVEEIKGRMVFFFIPQGPEKYLNIKSGLYGK